MVPVAICSLTAVRKVRRNFQDLARMYVFPVIIPDFSPGNYFLTDDSCQCFVHVIN
jgi:hypothetical protein